MQSESRVHKSILNAKVSFICYFVSLAVTFFSRKVFINQLGADFLGLVGSMQSVLSFLNLVELGVGIAVAFSLYAPITRGDKGEINEIISVFGFLYNVIGKIILGGGIIVSFFLPLIFPNTGFSWIVLYFGYYTLLATSLFTYFINYRLTLLYADQRQYEVTGWMQIINTIKTIIQIAVALYYKSFILYFAIGLVFGVVYSWILNKRIDKVYPWLKSDIKQGRVLLKKYPVIVTKVKQIFIHRIASFVQFQLTPFLVYAFVNLTTVTLYTNYTTITVLLVGLLQSTLDSANAGVGGLISEKDNQRTYALYVELLSMRMLVAMVFASTFFYSASPFISVWLGSQFPLDDTVVFLISLNLFMSVARGTTDCFIGGHGMYQDVWAPIVEACLFLASSCGFGYFWGLKGILIGPVFSLSVIVFLWKPYFLFSRGFKMSVLKYWYRFVKYLIVLTAVAVLTYWGCKNYVPIAIYSGWIGWVYNTAVYFVIAGVASALLLFAVEPCFRRFVYRIVKR